MRRTNKQSWHSRETVAKWFKKLPPEKRLEVAYQIELLRRGARVVRVRDDKE